MALPSVKKFQALEDVSVIGKKHPEADIVVNTSTKPKSFLIKDSVKGDNKILAPGEGQTPSNIMREYDFDVKSFPLKHTIRICSLSLKGDSCFLMGNK